MRIALKKYSRIAGVLLLVTGICIIPSFVVAMIYREQTCIQWFGGTMAFCLIPAALILRFAPPPSVRIKPRDGYLIVSLTWIIISLISAVPLTGSGAIPSFVDAFFEMCSGYSTTGSTILTDIEALPKSMLFWRSFTHWVGGMGIIVLGAAILPSLGIEGQVIASAETPGPTMDKLTAHYSDTAKRLYELYFAFTVIETVLLVFGGMGLFDALVHTFGTVGTGGYSDYNNGVAHFQSPYIQWVLILFMAMCGTNFNLYFGVPKKGLKAFLEDEECRLYLLIMLGCSLGIAADLLLRGVFSSLFESLTAAFFHVSSIMTTTGYSTENYDLWPTFSKMLLLVVFFTGASSSSTGGGPKIIRIVVAIKLIRRNVALKMHPHRFYNIKVNGRIVSQEVATSICNFLFFYVFVLIAGTLIISLNGFDLMTTFSAALTCLGNVGPGFALVGPVCNFSIFNPFSKIVLSFLMIAGRLELFTFFMLFFRRYWNPNRY